MKKVTIRTSKIKIVFGATISLIFSVFSALMLLRPDGLVSYFFRSPELIWLVGFITILFSFISLFYFLKRLFGNGFALIVDEEGIIENTNATSIGFVPWEDVVKIKKTRIASTDFLIIEVRDAKKYIAKSRNFFQTKIMKMNFKYYGTPITINSNTLKCNFTDLEQNVQSIFEEWKAKN